MPITVAGGVYHERCIWPQWDQIYGSGGRAAAALTGLTERVGLSTYLSVHIAKSFNETATSYGFSLTPVSVEQTVSFEYVHCLSTPQIVPVPSRIAANAAFHVEDEIVLRFGMMEGSAIVTADICIYDPQSAFAPRPFDENGSRARRLAIVANRSEITSMGGAADVLTASRNLLTSGAEVVVAKLGPAGALVVDSRGNAAVPAFRTDRVWTIGSGDVFAAAFAALWGVDHLDAVAAAELASKAVANYASTMALPSPSRDRLTESALEPAAAQKGLVYLASPFFSLGQRWVVDEARRHLQELGLNVFSPIHDVGPGPANHVAPADLKALDRADIVFAILDGLDSGTVFELGYAHAKNKPIYAVAQTVSDEDLKMILGSGGRVYDDFVTALHHVAWRV